ncbi:hypothetical protein AALB64_10775 [Lachnospiraceae bacterium 45-P1]
MVLTVTAQADLHIPRDDCTKRIGGGRTARREVMLNGLYAVTVWGLSELPLILL